MNIQPDSPDIVIPTTVSIVMNTIITLFTTITITTVKIALISKMTTIMTTNNTITLITKITTIMPSLEAEKVQ